VRRETGEEEVVRVHCDEGVANHVGPEPCAGNREGVGEASVGVRAGQPLSREIVLISGADAVTGWKATRKDALLRVSARPGVVIDPGMYGSSLHGNREISGSAIRPQPGDVWSAAGRR
jgi:hypothetical protein